jgi:hypothetical protein
LEELIPYRHICVLQPFLAKTVGLYIHSPSRLAWQGAKVASSQLAVEVAQGEPIEFET